MISGQPPQAFQSEIHVEGRARLVTQNAFESARVFYNPRMSLNRDLAVLFAQSFFTFSRSVNICDPTCASGVRAVRYALELPSSPVVLAGDKDPLSVETAQTIIQLNQVQDRVSVLESDANLLLLNHEDERFDLVDLDPFGSPALFFDSAVKATLDGGVLTATATDMGPLTGARATAGFRKYGVTLVKTEFEKEIAARTLAGCLAATAARIGLGVEIAFTHAVDHYVRIYAIITKGKKNANSSMKHLGFVEYCRSCLRRDSRNSLQSLCVSCESCTGRKSIIGPVWIGELWNGSVVARMTERTPLLVSNRLSEIQRLLSMIEEEAEAPPFHYRMDVLSAKLKMKPQRMQSFLGALREQGYVATRSHFDPCAFRTNATSLEIATLARSFTESEAKKV